MMFSVYYTYELLYDMLSRMIPAGMIHIELGVLQGASLSSFASLLKKYNKPNLVYGIDIFDDYSLLKRTKKGHDPFDRTKSLETVSNNIKHAGNIDLCRLVKKTTDDAVAFFRDEKVFSVFIDADHEYKSVKKDLNNYYDLVVPDGFVTGHDIKKEPVKKAFYEFIKERKIKDNNYDLLPKIDCFLIRKP